MADTMCVLNDQVDYFGFLQLGSFYILLGISCDYVFLYFDAYMQSLVEPLVAATLATRISYMCQRATPVRPPKSSWAPCVCAWKP